MDVIGGVEIKLGVDESCDSESQLWIDTQSKVGFAVVDAVPASALFWIFLDPLTRGCHTILGFGSLGWVLALMVMGFALGFSLEMHGPLVALVTGCLGSWTSGACNGWASLIS